MEVEQEPQRLVEQFHVTWQLGVMDRQDFMNGLELDEKTTPDEQVKTQRLLEEGTLVVEDSALNRRKRRKQRTSITPLVL
jgi:hypothetical protein